MCDFVSSEGCNIIKNDSIYSLDKNELLNFVKGIQIDIQRSCKIELKIEKAIIRMNNKMNY